MSLESRFPQQCWLLVISTFWVLLIMHEQDCNRNGSSTWL